MPAATFKTKLRCVVTAALILAGAALLSIGAFRFDDWTGDRIAALQGKGWKKSEQRVFQGSVSRYGDWPFLMVAGAVGVLAAWRLRNGRWQRILITAMVASTVAGALVNAARLTTGRTRPNASPKIEAGWYGPYHEGRILIGDSRYNAFPSGHTATAVAFAGVILFASPAIGTAAMIVALGIAWSRMMLGAHHLSDVVVASLVALAVAWFAWRLAVQRGNEIAAWIRAKVRRKS